MNPGMITVLFFVAAIAPLVAGFPIAFGLLFVSMVFGYFFWSPASLSLAASTAWASMGNDIILAAPLFIFMANMLAKSGVAENLYEVMHRWMGPLRGGLAMGTIVICAIFSAMTGISAAATVTMGLISLPAMLKRNYHHSLAVGPISAGGALGILIPPSVILIVYGLIASESVGQLFAAGVIPGFLLSAMFITYIAIRAFFQPSLAPALPAEERYSWKDKVISLKGVILPVLLVLAVLGSIFWGITTITEAAAVGAFGSAVCAVINHKFTWESFKSTNYKTIQLTTMVMWLIFASSLFSNIYSSIGTTEFVFDFLLGMNLGRWGVMFIMQLSFFVFGCFLDPVGIITILGPLYCPIATALGFDLVWFGILFVINMEMAYLTPPFGYNLFYMKAVAPKSITLQNIYKDVLPFLFIQAICLIITIIFPQIALWLPGQLIHKIG